MSDTKPENILITSEAISLVQYRNSGDVFSDIKSIIEVSRKQAYRFVDLILLRRNWLMGKRIAEEELINGNRADNYGLEIIRKLSAALTAEYGKGFTKTNLYNYYRFYKTFPDIFHTACGNSYPLLSW